MINEKLIQHAFAGDDITTDSYSLKEALEFFWGRKLIDVGELAEQAISNTSGIDQHKPNTKGSDLTDGSEIKYASVYYDKHSTYATISGFKNKTGTIRGWVYEQKTKKNYYFLIPHSVYSLYCKGNKKSTMKIWFDHKGKPKNPVNNINPNIWDYKVTERQFMKFKQ